MATKKTEEDNKGGETGTELAPAQFGTDLALTGDLGSEVEGLTGFGYSERAEDSLVPILAILQDNSAEVKRQHSKYIDGSKAGDLIIRSMGLVLDPERDFLAVQFAGFQHMWVQWDGEPGAGTVVAQYPFDDRPAEAEERQLKDDDKRKTWVMPDGTRLVDTRYHYAQILLPGLGWMPIVIPFAGTNHTVSRGLTNQLKMLKLPNGGRCPSWFRAFNLRTKFNQDGSQSWFTYEVKDAGWITDAEIRAGGRALFESLEANTISADVASESQKDGGKGGEGVEDNIPI